MPFFIKTYSLKVMSNLLLNKYLTNFKNFKTVKYETVGNQ